jgi:hypothetical protein
MGLTIASLIKAYTTDTKSAHYKLSYAVRIDRERYLKRLDRQYGDHSVSSITHRTLSSWHKRWSHGGKFATGQAFIGQLRALFRYGFLALEDDDCEHLCGVLDNMKFRTTKPRGARLTSVHANAIRYKAHEFGYHSIALAQAFQHELLMSQKDVIGEWLPAAEAVGAAKIEREADAWIAGLCWEEIDDNFVLRHPTTTREGCIEVDLTKALTVLEDLERSVWAYDKSKPVLRSYFPKRGPVVICEYTALPWDGPAFRKKWRLIADYADVPSSIKNMDSRAGATIVRIAGRNFRFFERPRPGQL